MFRTLGSAQMGSNAYYVGMEYNSNVTKMEPHYGSTPSSFMTLITSGRNIREDEEDEWFHKDANDKPDEETVPSFIQTPTKDMGTSRVPFKEQVFQSLEEAQLFYKDYGLTMGFSTMIRSTQKRRRGDDRPSSCVLSCARVSNRKKVVVQENNSELPHTKRVTSTIKCGCKAQLRLSRFEDEKWHVTNFNNEHNHNMVTPSKKKHMRGNRNMPMGAKSLVEAFRETNLPVGKVVEVLDGEMVGFDERDCWNHLGSTQEYKKPIVGDATAMLNFFKKKSIEDPQFFYEILSDLEGKAINFYWVDGQSRMQYKIFGDVVYFDTTYKKNVYEMPFAPFTGVNHHLQSIQFGCALLLDETVDSFVWAFEAFLRAMEEAPRAIITDQDRAMGVAIGRVFPNTRHRFCLWHILKKFPIHLSHVYFKKSAFKKDIKSCIRRTYRIGDFEHMWREIMIKYELMENEWLNSMYEIREKWVPVYHLDTFYAGINTTGRSEGMNSFYKNFFTLRTSLREFAYKNDKCLERIATRERNEDYASEHKDRLVEKDEFLLIDAAKVYTRNVYLKFKLQWDMAKKDYQLHDLKTVEAHNTYIYKSRNEDDKIKWVVEFNSNTREGKCECKYFDFMCIPCGHLIKVFQIFDYDKIPEYFVSKRWKKGANEYRCNYDGGLILGHQTSKLIRNLHLSKVASELTYEASEMDETYAWMAKKFTKLSKKLEERKKKIKEKSNVGSSNGHEKSPNDITRHPDDECQTEVDIFQAPPVDGSQPSPFDASQTPSINISQPTVVEPEMILLNPSIVITKGRKKSCHKGGSSRIKGVLERTYKNVVDKGQSVDDKQGKRQCKYCNAIGERHDKRNCPDNPNRKMKN